MRVAEVRQRLSSAKIALSNNSKYEWGQITDTIKALREVSILCDGLIHEYKIRYNRTLNRSRVLLKVARDEKKQKHKTPSEDDNKSCGD